MFPAQARAEDDEEAGDEDKAEGFLEIEDVVHGHAFLVGHGDTHDGDGEEARAGLQGFGGDERAGDGGEREGDVKGIGNPEAAEENNDDAGGENSDGCAGADGADGFDCQDVGRGEIMAEADRFKREDGAEGAEGIGDDSFPAQDGADMLQRANVAHEGADDGGAGDHEDRSEQRGEGPGKAEPISGGDGGNEGGEDRADGDQIRYDAADAANIGDMKT